MNGSKKKISKSITEIHIKKYPKIQKFPHFFVKKMTNYYFWFKMKFKIYILIF